MVRKTDIVSETIEEEAEVRRYTQLLAVASPPLMLLSKVRTK